MKRVEASMSKFDFLAGFVLGALTVLGIMLIIMFGLNSEHDEKENSSPEVSETVSETCEFHNAESTTKPSQAPTPSPTPKSEPTPEPKETPPQIPEVSVAPAINVSEYSDDELIAFAEKLVFRKGGFPEGYVLINDPEVSIETDDITEIAKEYATLLNLDKWTGFSTEYNGHKVSTDKDEIKIDGKLTGVKTNERIYSDIARELYYRGVWNGKRFTLGNYEISLNEDWGYLLIEGYCSCFNQRSIDLPDNVSSYPGYYTPGKGTTVEVDDVSYTYLKGELIKVGNHKLP